MGERCGVALYAVVRRSSSAACASASGVVGGVMGCTARAVGASVVWEDRIRGKGRGTGGSAVLQTAG